jgi:hypothetical protein
MNEPLSPETIQPPEPAPDQQPLTLGTSSLFKLFEAFIALREKNDRQHKVFEQSLVKSRDNLQASFNSFAADTQRAYQQLRQEIHGEKRMSLALLNELLEISFDLEQIVGSRPPAVIAAVEGGNGADNLNTLDEAALRSQLQTWGQWSEAIEVEARKVQAALMRHGVHPYDAVIGSAYNPALHERVGSRRMDGMDPLRIAEQRERGLASQQPEFILRRPKVIVSE